MEKLSLFVGMAFDVVAAVASGVSEYLLTSGKSGWIPLVTNLAGFVGACLLVSLVFPKKRRLKLWKKVKQKWAQWKRFSPYRKEGRFEFETWSVAPSAGKNAARAIITAPSIETAESIFDAFRSQSDRKDPTWAYHAFARRLRDFGDQARSDAMFEKIGFLEVNEGWNRKESHRAHKRYFAGPVDSLSSA